MIKLNDHYFIAWLNIVKGYEFVIGRNQISVYMTPAQYTQAKEEYELGHKPILKEIRRTVKLLASLTSKSE